jgi:molybdenum-dependent DNA-binding transcriptional regulator ModE
MPLRPRKKASATIIGERLQKEYQERRDKFKELVSLTMNQENVPYEEAKRLIKQTSVATLIAIEFSMIN